MKKDASIQHSSILGYFLKYPINKDSNRIAIYCGNQTYTFSEINILSLKASQLIKNRGIKRGERIIIALKNSPEFIFFFFGAFIAGVIPVPINFGLGEDEYESIRVSSGAKLIIIHNINQIIKTTQNNNLNKFLLPIGEPNSFRDTTVNIKTHKLVTPNIEYWLYTSGTTGKAKIVIQNLNNMIFSCENYAKKVLGINRDDVVFSTASVSFGYGLANSIFFPLAVNCTTIIVPEKPSAESIIEIINKYKPTIFFSVPSIYNKILKLTNCGLLYSLRLAVSAGEALPKAIFKKWNHIFKVKILDGIGSTEVGHIFISNTSKLNRAGSSGVPVPGYKIKIVDDDNKEIKHPNIQGILKVKGSNTFSGYWKNKKETNNIKQKGWITTGDRYCRDKDGFYLFKGRIKESFKVSAKWLFPLEVEAILNDHPAILESVVVPFIDPDGLTKPKAYIVLNKKYKFSKNLIMGIKNIFLRKKKMYQYPKEFVTLDQLSRTNNGKIDRIKLISQKNV